MQNVIKKESVDLKELLSNKKFIPIYSSRKNLNERELGPVAIELHWTSICNYNCIHCSYGTRRQHREKLSHETIHCVIRDLIALQTRGVYLSGGGEPTTVTGWDKYALELISNGVEVALITNGVKVAEVHLDVLRKMNYIAVSLYSTEGNEYEEITGGKVFEKQFLLPSLLRKESGDTVIGARCVLNKINYKNVVYIYQRAMKAGFDYIIFIPVIDYEDTGIDLQQEEMLSLHDILINNYDKFDSSKTNVDSLIMRKSHYYDVTDYRESLRDPNMGCRVIQIRGNAFINYDGGVYLCQPHIGDERYCIGNINETRLIEIWNSSFHLEVIDRLNHNFASGLCKNCRSIGFNKAADEYDQGRTTFVEAIKDIFI